MGREGRNEPPAPGAPDVARGLAASLVTALKNLAIYPASHPRVATAAREFVEHLRHHCGDRRSCRLVARGDGLLLDQCRVGGDDVGVAWLVQRLRDAGLRGVELENECSHDDVLAFATALNQARSRSGTKFTALWNQGTSRVVPLPLVYQGHHDPNAPGPDAAGGAGDPTAAATSTPPNDPGDTSVRGLIARMAGTAAVQERLRSIETHARGDDVDDRKQLDLFELISDLLPADVASNPALIEDVVHKVLGRVDESMQELVRRKAKVKGADLLRKALGVARKYFQTSAPSQPAPTGLPSGRPEDDKITADLGILLQEIEALPSTAGLWLPGAAEMASAKHLVAREVLGVCLHGVATSSSSVAIDRLRTRLEAARVNVLAEVADLIAVYAGPAADGAGVSAAVRTLVIATLVEAGHVDFVRSRGYVDTGFVSGTFPDSMPLAAKVLGSDEAGQRVLREALARVAPMIDAGGEAAIAASGILAEPTVVRALFQTGGPDAGALLVQAAARALPAMRQVLRDHLRTLPLPPAEAAVVHSYDQAELLPRDYLAQLLGALANRRFDATLRAASGELLRRRVQLPPDALSPEARLAAISNLIHAPGTETRRLLQRLAGDRLLPSLSARVRAVRKAARATLTALDEISPP